MPSDAQKRATARYQAALQRITIRCKPEEAAVIKAAAAEVGKSTQRYIIDTLLEAAQK